MSNFLIAVFMAVTMGWIGLPERPAIQRLSTSNIRYGSLYLFLVTVTLTVQILGDAVHIIGDLSPYYVDSRLFWTIGYTCIGMTVLCIGIASYVRTHRTTNHLDSYEWVRILLALCLVLLVVLYSLLGSATRPATTTRMLTEFVISVVGLGLLSATYLRVRGIEIRLNAPDRSAVWVAGTVVLVPAILVVWTLIYSWISGPQQLLFDDRFVRDLPPIYLLENVVIASAFSAFGTGLLFHGVIQETLREGGQPTEAIIETTILGGFYVWVSTQVLVPVRDVVTLLTVFAAIGIIVLVTPLVFRLWQGLDLIITKPVYTEVRAVMFGISVVLLLFVATYLGHDQTSVLEFTYLAGFSVTIGIAAAAYERTRSVWVPVLAFASFEAGHGIIAYLQHLGLASLS